MSESDELLPLTRPQKAHLPFDISSLKRQSSKQPDSKRMRTYNNDEGDEIIIDAALLDDMEYALSDSEDEEIEQKQRSLSDKKKRERNQRSFIASEIVRSKRRGKQKLTTTESKLERVLTQSNYTNEDMAGALANDAYNLISAPVLSPFQSLVNKTLGPEQPRTACFGCTKGVGLARIAPRTISNLEMMIKDTIASQDIWVSCLMISQYFEEEIMIPSNASRRKGETEIQPWTERSIYDHLTKHVLEPSFVLYNCIMQLRNHIEIIADSGLYKVPREIAEQSGREIDKTDLIIDPVRHKQLMETTKLLVQLMQQKPDTMMFSNSNFNMTSTPQRIITPKASATEVTHMKSIFTKTDLSKKAVYK